VKVNGAAAGVDHVTAEEFERHLEEHREKLSHAPKEGSYRPQAVRRGMDSQAGEQGETSPGNSHGARPGGTSRTPSTSTLRRSRPTRSAMLS
jgi:hypothetical protein